VYYDGLALQLGEYKELNRKRGHVAIPTERLVTAAAVTRGILPLFDEALDALDQAKRRLAK